MPEAKHYGNTLLDNCYLYTFDEKFKNDTKTHLGDKTFEGVTLKLKDEHNDMSLKKEKIIVKYLLKKKAETDIISGTV